MAKMVKITCACGCGKTKMVRQADVDRGWGKYFSKSCKARHQESRTGQHKAHKTNAVKMSYGLNECDGSSSFSQSSVRSNKLYCNGCNKKIKQGDWATWEIEDGTGKMVNVFCSSCGDEYTHEVIMDSVHPFSSEGLGQD